MPSSLNKTDQPVVLLWLEMENVQEENLKN